MPLDLSPRWETSDVRMDAQSQRRCSVIQRPSGMGAFQFVVLATLRAAQLMRGCRPRVDGIHKATVTAQLEVAEGKVTQAANAPVSAGEPHGAPVADASILVQPA